MAPGGTCEFLSLCTRKQRVRARTGSGEQRSLAGAPRADSLSSAARAPDGPRSRGFSALPDITPTPPSITGDRLLPGAGWVLLGARCLLLRSSSTKFLSSRCRLCPRPRRLGLRSDPHPQSFLSPVANVAPADLPGGYCEGSVNQQRPGARFARQASNLTGRNFGRDRTAGGCPVGFTF